MSEMRRKLYNGFSFSTGAGRGTLLSAVCILDLLNVLLLFGALFVLTI